MEKIGDWFWFDATETFSTNDEADKLCGQLKSKCVVTAKRQTAGRGRYGRSWISEEGNLFMSFAFPAPLANIGQIAVLGGLAVLKTVRFFCPDIRLQIKWPNDVLAEGGKISGILFERATNGFWIMGIGINIVSHPEISATGYLTASLNAFGAKTERLTVLRKFVSVWDNMFETYCQEGFSVYRQQWLDNAYNLGKTITIKQWDKKICGIFAGINDDGSLILETTEGRLNVLTGDVFAATDKEENEKI